MLILERQLAECSLKLNVEKGLARLWLVVTLTWVGVLGCYTSCDAEFISHYVVPLSALGIAALYWACRGFYA
jgi:hypothetical protein